MKPRVPISTILLVGFLLLITIPQLSLGGRSDAYYEEKRQEMVAPQIDARSVKDGRIGVKDKQVLEAMRSTPRHEFVPTHLKSRAHFDSPLPIGYDQTISQPYTVAYMTESLELKKSTRCLRSAPAQGIKLLSWPNWSIMSTLSRLSKNSAKVPRSV